MKLSVVILNYNVRYFLELCLRSVQAAIANLDAEIIVVDNQSSDDSCRMVKQFFPEVILIENKENFGFSKGNNIGVAKAQGEYLCILNPDTVVSEDTFIKILAYMKNHINIGILGCQLIDGRGQFLPESKRNIPSPLVSIKKILGFSKAYYANHLSPTDTGKVDILVGAFMVLRKEIYDQVEGFDEDYFMYGEDIDLSYKVLKAGYENIYFGETAILHFKGESTLKDKIYAKRFHGAMQVFYNKHFKSNLVFDIIVWFGILFSRLLFRNPSQIDQNVTSHKLMTKSLHFNTELPFNITTVQSLAEASAHSQVVFDGNTIDYKSVIECMMFSDKDKEFTFRILPRNSKFIIGSDSAEQQGEVVLI
ncbi:glycosyltransferase family 2 protein [Gelidibacter sp.]|uniref:glycosyltransferase family 2 protein n=1 Tax=Gelidibacter sp. TaxID=2018083 RepID=UPI002C4FBB5D|nr:glycosyltransferase family 2 protein [Gelidibacter sp.]HUH28405.1 glycosyltransferase family 2 protein [Gelidibacter sp.]